MTRLSPPDLPGTPDQDSTWSNPAKLSRKVHELAHQSHRALKANTKPHVLAPSGPEDSHQDLRDLRIQLARLQEKIHALRLVVLVPWVDALRRQVEDRLSSADMEGRR